MPTIERRKTREGKIRYKARVRVAGYPQKTATFERRADALRWAAQLEQEMRTGRYASDAAAWMHTARDMIDRYMRHVLPVKSDRPRYVQAQAHQLRWWRHTIGEHRLATVTPFVLSDCRDALQARGLSAGTVNNYLAALSHVFTTARKEWGWVASNPVAQVRKLREPAGRVRFLSAEEMAALLSACRRVQRLPLYEIVLLAIATGARKSELLGIRCRDVDTERGVITIHDTKNHSSRALTITGDPLARVAARMQARRDSQLYLFEHPRTGKPYCIERAWRNARSQADIEDVHFHDLRHTFASYMAMSSATLGDISEALGHKTLNMVKRYAHLADSHTAQVVAGMHAKFLQGKAAQEGGAPAL